MDIVRITMLARQSHRHSLHSAPLAHIETVSAAQTSLSMADCFSDHSHASTASCSARTTTADLAQTPVVMTPASRSSWRLQSLFSAFGLA
ncbi:hypothetical protein BATDEDRAFT_88140 [Batrachochytrium dendrobatidis JAM81]|uniref:Uncharacterized protein n=2 Tax=Batrachochytrium dendrobatidis TaxID=109871 RepID=F4P284_BATDJ|nr:uncharacterized protein BATDEDRAFT_88140 [Batrachochytrium dendrobatidis JAM81]EGF80810.1 hypothetical protein BATDEDRAFT_88140 [Batrachochytrium dendrobatidis JAM81]KAJ8329124.1 hypothetical protein O5D80_003072 [Batrachochytrium dendrobatidis]KAK5669069.1 hypothetical protein QVD99_004833 [Batrachochytrium dendrobatidis]OAJ42010.1 hypothetical protein BDEG_25520 [Batrachochytrium dendrobatidis JEL423]|eukprot:XP_006678707.1 hypothetical protein BATDEDRAFT_88140 [Batrachochytrium dendrobatidis JAM81]